MTGRLMHPYMVDSLVIIKKAAAMANQRAGVLKPEIASAIIRACDEILGGKLRDQFVVDPIQGGAGTSANMNANEVIANRATEILGGQKGEALVHPNDHVNMAQSTNDVFPSAGKLTAIRLTGELLEALDRLRTCRRRRGKRRSCAPRPAFTTRSATRSCRPGSSCPARRAMRKASAPHGGRTSGCC